MRTNLLRLGLLGLVLTCLPAYADDITECEQGLGTWEPHHQLTKDLDCVRAHPAVFLPAGSTLSLNGFTIRGGSFSVYCRGRCSIIGPGVLDSGFAESAGTGVKMGAWANLHLSDVTILNRARGLEGYERRGRNGHRMTLTNVAIDNCREFAISAAGVIANGLTVTNCGPSSFRGATIDATRVDGSNISVVGNPAAGISAHRIRVRNLVATGNAGPAVLLSTRLRATDSILEGNDIDGSGIDVETRRRPVLKNSTCGASSNAVGGSWGICAED